MFPLIYSSPVLAFLFWFLYTYVLRRAFATIVDLIHRPFYMVYEYLLLQDVPTWKLPKHIGIIMDGNRRYAKVNGLSCASEGHSLGAKKLTEVLEWCYELNIPIVTVWCLSVDNLKREKEELEKIFSIFEENFQKIFEREDHQTTRDQNQIHWPDQPIAREDPKTDQGRGRKDQQIRAISDEHRYCIWRKRRSSRCVQKLLN
eukprot:TRINITY_DN6627_c0_g1_i3.p1 TRINITY_DN6627_c0_g1~~TRINITY_DN6627_c0_g1_i3.p1  ORF type:complete len:202 (-),score=27.04 TRINITY_DN6627_c0_g1_i3:264-869(-)